MEKQFLLPANILLPKKDAHLWSVIACDQYTSEPEYWEKVKETVGCAPSALNIILPEAYLSDDDSEKIKKINQTMNDYLSDNVFKTIENSIIYTQRTLKNGKVRKGLVGLIDLEDYSYKKGAKTATRATEETVLERIPPRVEIRKDAVLEIPHIMMLIDDPQNTVFGCVEATGALEKVYDFTLMQNAGSIIGYSLPSDYITNVQNALLELSKNSADGLVYAVGDGNHSLATAKECYKMGKGSRYALVEVVNIHDNSLEFEPIYRVLFGADAKSVMADFVAWCGGEYFGEDAQKFTCVYGEIEKEISVKGKGTLCVATLQTFLDGYIREKGITIDYIHGTDSVRQLCKNENTLGFIFEGMGKSDLFKAVSQDGSLPRKTFSMGCADDKRFYLEARIIK
ncbi:MAG: DUF1015 domain-containing protein [Ruminococcaceae bacterium]|nr:DUF1015 domain-containing protein [Oscillospiraceae bacterium]